MSAQIAAKKRDDVTVFIAIVFGAKNLTPPLRG